MAFDPKQTSEALGHTMQSSMAGVAAASRTMQALANEMVGMSMDSLKQTSQAFEQMQGARTWSDVTRIQSEFFKTAFEQFAQRSQRIAQLAAAGPKELAERASATMKEAGAQAQSAVRSVAEDAKASTVGLEPSVPPGRPGA